VCSIAAAQHAQVHRTQNAGQPLSGADSIVPIGHVSGISSELTPLASAMSTASTAMNNTRRIRLNLISWLSIAPDGCLSTFDTVEPVQHPKDVATLRHAIAVAAVLTLMVGNIAVCAGWEASPEARMACCMNGTSCPMHKSDSHKASSTRLLSQAQADSCCAAASQGRDSAAAGSTFAASGVIVLAPAAVFTLPTSTSTSQGWRALVPLPVSSTPRHLLLSVFLV